MRGWAEGDLGFTDTETEFKDGDDNDDAIEM